MSSPETRYQLDAGKLQGTIEGLACRIGERFPESGLATVAGTLEEIGKRAADLSAQVARPIWPVRIACGVLLVVFLAVIVGTLLLVRPAAPGDFDLATFVGLVESLINDVVLLGVAAFFLLTLESRLKRRRVLKAMHELRSIAHVIDMHQLTKDPYRLTLKRQDTPSSPQPELTEFELCRYLDYCSELLSLVAKLAALQINHLDDSQIIAAVNEVESLCNGIARKIWQKIASIG